MPAIYNNLTNSEKRILEYFWNDKLKQAREELSTTIITFFENEKYSSQQAQQLNAIHVMKTTNDLEQKGFLIRMGTFQVNGPNTYSLSIGGHRYIDEKHPKLKVKLQQLIQSTPQIITIIVGIVGFVASVFGIYEFFKQLGGKS